MIVFLLCEEMLNWWKRCLCDTLAFSKHGTGHAFKGLGWPCPATFRLSPWAPKHVLWHRMFQGASGFKIRSLIYWTGAFAIFVRWLLAWRYISLLHSAVPTVEQTAVYCCDPALILLLVMEVPQNVFLVVSALQFIVCLYIFVFWLIRSLGDPTLAAFIVCGPLQFIASHLMFDNETWTFVNMVYIDCS